MWCLFLFFKQKTAYEMRISDWSSDVCSSDLVYNLVVLRVVQDPRDTSAADGPREALTGFVPQLSMMVSAAFAILAIGVLVYFLHHIPASIRINTVLGGIGRKLIHDIERRFPIEGGSREPERRISGRSEEHTSAVQLLMRISY